METWLPARSDENHPEYLTKAYNRPNKFNHVSIIKGVPPISSPVRNRPRSQHP
jgi:hypothetical protein